MLGFQHFLLGSRNQKPWRGDSLFVLPFLGRHRLSAGPVPHLPVYSQCGDLGQAVPLLTIWGEGRRRGSWSQRHRVLGALLLGANTRDTPPAFLWPLKVGVEAG